MHLNKMLGYGAPVDPAWMQKAETCLGDDSRDFMLFLIDQKEHLVKELQDTFPDDPDAYEDVPEYAPVSDRLDAVISYVLDHPGKEITDFVALIPEICQYKDLMVFRTLLAPSWFYRGAPRGALDHCEEEILGLPQWTDSVNWLTGSSSWSNDVMRFQRTHPANPLPWGTMKARHRARRLLESGESPSSIEALFMIHEIILLTDYMPRIPADIWAVVRYIESDLSVARKVFRSLRPVLVRVWEEEDDDDDDNE